MAHIWSHANLFRRNSWIFRKWKMFCKNANANTQRINLNFIVSQPERFFVDFIETEENGLTVTNWVHKSREKKEKYSSDILYFCVGDNAPNMKAGLWKITAKFAHIDISKSHGWNTIRMIWLFMTLVRLIFSKMLRHIVEHLIQSSTFLIFGERQQLSNAKRAQKGNFETAVILNLAEMSVNLTQEEDMNGIHFWSSQMEWSKPRSCYDTVNYKRKLDIWKKGIRLGFMR